MLIACCSSTSLHHPFLLSLNSLDLAGVRLLSPRDSQILPKQLQVPTMPVQMTQPRSSGSSMKIVFVVLFRFQLISSGSHSGRSGICSIRGSLLLFWFRSRTLIVSGWCNAYSCIVWSGDCKPTMYLFSLMYYMGCVKITSLATLLSMRLCL